MIFGLTAFTQLIGFSAPNHHVPASQRTSGRRVSRPVQCPEGRPPPHTLRSFAQDSLPVAVVVGMHAIDDVVLHEKEQRRNPELAVLHLGEILACQAISAVVSGASSGVRTSVAMRR